MSNDKLIRLLEEALTILRGGSDGKVIKKEGGMRWSKLPAKIYLDGEDTGQYKECDYLHIDDFNFLLEHKELLADLPAKIIGERVTYEYFKSDKDQKFSEKQKKVLDIAWSQLKKVLAEKHAEKKDLEPKEAIITEWSSKQLTDKELGEIF